MVAPAEPGCLVGHGEKCVDFETSEKGNEVTLGALLWNGEHPFDQAGVRRLAERRVAKERAHGCEPRVSGPRAIAPLLLEVVEESRDERRVDVGQEQV